jgi:hypothetical protein
MRDSVEPLNKKLNFTSMDLQKLFGVRKFDLFVKCIVARFVRLFGFASIINK